MFLRLSKNYLILEIVVEPKGGGLSLGQVNEFLEILNNAEFLIRSDVEFIRKFECANRSAKKLGAYRYRCSEE